MRKTRTTTKVLEKRNMRPPKKMATKPRVVSDIKNKRAGKTKNKSVIDAKDTCNYGALENAKKQAPRRNARCRQKKGVRSQSSSENSGEVVSSVMEQNENGKSDSMNTNQNLTSRKRRRNNCYSRVKDLNACNSKNNAKKLDNGSKTETAVTDDCKKDKSSSCERKSNLKINRRNLKNSETEMTSHDLLPLKKKQKTFHAKDGKTRKNKTESETRIISDLGKVKSPSKRKASQDVNESPQKRQKTQFDQSKKLVVSLTQQISGTTDHGAKLYTKPQDSSLPLEDDGKDKNMDNVEKTVDKQRIKMQDTVDSDSDSDVEWEEVEEAGGATRSPSKTSPSKKVNTESLEISIQMPGKKKKKSSNCKEDIMAHIAKAVKRFKKEAQENLHKVHLLTLVAHGMYRSTVCNDPFFKAVMLSFVPAHFVLRPVRRWDVAELTALVTWFNNDFHDIKSSGVKSEQENLQLKSLSISEVFVALLRALGFLVRLVLSFQPVTLKVSQNNKISKGSKAKKRSSASSSQQSDSSELLKITSGSPTTSGHVNVKCNDAKSLLKCSPGPSGLSEEYLKSIRNKNNEETNCVSKNLEEKSASPKSGSRNKSFTKQNASKPKSARKSGPSAKGVEKKQSSDELTGKDHKKRSSGRGKQKVSYIESGNESEDELSDESSWNEQLTVEENSDSEDFVDNKKGIKKKLNFSAKKIKQERKRFGKQKQKCSSDMNDESKQTANLDQSTKKQDQVNSCGKRTLSLDSKKDSGEGAVDSWIEVYLPSEKKWNCIDLISSSVNHPVLCTRNARDPIVYVLGYDNENNVKDVTSRYASEWLSKTRKMRVDQEWWSETLELYKTKNWRMEKAENAILQAQSMERPLPTSITEYKNHPLYILKRHLLKFEAIYPETAATLGFCRNEAVYSRDCLHQLHTRETWLKEAKVVKKGEEPYKIVKGRKKRNQPNPNAEVTCELFGEWQTEDYKPPPAVDGKVPRNEYGNVEMFKSCMLPPGTVHIKIPGIQRVAKKLGIDCAQAVVGFDFHGGFTHPVIDGVIVCKEFEKTLKDAWRAEEKEAKRRAEEKREKRILGNWRHLVLSLRIRERLKRKYNTEEQKPKLGKVADEELGSEMAVSWPLNVQEGKKSVGGAGHCHVFLDSGHKKDPITGEWSKSCACGLTLPFESM